MTKERETIVEFPCQFPIKAMGKNEDTFEALVTSLVREHVCDDDLLSIKNRPSKELTYTSITVTIRATSQSQLDAIYMALTACEHVKYAL